MEKLPSSVLVDFPPLDRLARSHVAEVVVEEVLDQRHHPSLGAGDPAAVIDATIVVDQAPSLALSNSTDVCNCTSLPSC